MVDIRVQAQGKSHGGSASYLIKPARARPSAQELGRVLGQKHRVEHMARRELGRAFIEVHAWSNNLELRVKTGTSKAPKTRRKLRNLLGWITLMDVELGAGQLD